LGSQQTTAELAIGSDFAGYRIEEVAARGGMGVVYRATQLQLTRTVALKLVTPALARDASFRDRFRREWMVAAAIEHPNVIPVYEAGEEDGALYIAMRWVEGTDLREAIDSGPLEPSRAVNLVSQVAGALGKRIDELDLALAIVRPQRTSAHAHAVARARLRGPARQELGGYFVGFLHSGIVRRMRRAKLRRQTSFSLRGPTV